MRGVDEEKGEKKERITKTKERDHGGKEGAGGENEGGRELVEKAFDEPI